METLIQFWAGGGPIALAIMGLVVTLRAPKGRRAALVWSIAFVLVGLATATSAFLEFRGTDQTLASIWNKVNEAKHPRLEYSGFKFSDESQDGSIQATIRFANTSETDIGSFRAISGVFAQTDEPQPEAIAKVDGELRKQWTLETSEKGFISRGMGLNIPANLGPDVFSEIKAGKVFYITATIDYKAKNSTIINTTEFCARITYPNLEHRACNIHNDYFASK